MLPMNADGACSYRIFQRIWCYSSLIETAWLCQDQLMSNTSNVLDICLEWNWCNFHSRLHLPRFQGYWRIFWANWFGSHSRARTSSIPPFHYQEKSCHRRERNLSECSRPIPALIEWPSLTPHGSSFWDMYHFQPWHIWTLTLFDKIFCCHRRQRWSVAISNYSSDRRNWRIFIWLIRNCLIKSQI